MALVAGDLRAQHNSTETDLRSDRLPQVKLPPRPRVDTAVPLPHPAIMNVLLVMTGGAIGAGARFVAGRMLPSGAWPWGTLAVNLAGGMLMGLLAGSLARGGGGGEATRLFLGTGVLGGFTTFSAFSLETATMIERGALGSAAGYAALSVAGAVAALFAGLAVARAA